jgi:hypothetical protein
VEGHESAAGRAKGGGAFPGIPAPAIFGPAFLQFRGNRLPCIGQKDPAFITGYLEIHGVSINRDSKRWKDSGLVQPAILKFHHKFHHELKKKDHHERIEEERSPPTSQTPRTFDLNSSSSLLFVRLVWLVVKILHSRFVVSGEPKMRIPAAAGD